VNYPSVNMGDIIRVLSEDAQKKKLDELDIVDEVDIKVAEAENEASDSNEPPTRGEVSQSNIAVAVEKYDLGYRITDLEELRAGDFIDLSRENNSGHTVVFLEWIREGDRKIESLGLSFGLAKDPLMGLITRKNTLILRIQMGKNMGM